MALFNLSVEGPEFSLKKNSHHRAYLTKAEAKEISSDCFKQSR
jgi:hypothetical protein